MNIKQNVWSLIFKLALGCAATGALIDKSQLANFGMASGIFAGGQVVIGKQRKYQKQLQEQLISIERFSQQELIKVNQINSSLNNKLDQAVTKVDKQQKQLKTQLTRQRLNLSAVHKLCHQHKSVVNRVVDCEQKLLQQNSCVSTVLDYLFRRH